ncbi:hypothetical protein ACWEVP_22365 [Amycolatopsis sp. NPDC003865]
MNAGSDIDRGGMMSGQDAASGFEYQFLSTLSFTLADLHHDDRFTAVVVDAPLSEDPRVDQEIVDFALMRGEGCRLAAQVKGGAPGSSMNAADAARVLLRLLTQDAERYALITNRRAGSGLLELVDVLRSGDPREGLAALLSRSPKVEAAVVSAGPEWAERLGRVDIVIDDRSIDELRTAVREQVRNARRKFKPEGASWDAAGLLTGYLVAEVLARAASREGTTLDRASLETALRIDREALRSLMHERDWAVPVTPVPRATDVARPEVLIEIGRTLRTPVADVSAPVCVLTGLSGIGKTGIATAWLEDRADSYDWVLWIEAASPSRIEASFVQAAARLLQGERGVEETARDAVHGVLARSARPWLMVFDNAPSLREIRDWLPTSGYGHVLVTTVDPTAVTGPGTASVSLTAMTEDQAVTLLSVRLLADRSATNDEVDVLRALARRLQYWPLALEIAAAYLNDCLGGIIGVESYEQLLMRSLADEQSVPPGYPHTLVRAIELAFHRMAEQPEQADRIAVAALRRASLFAPRGIPLHLLLSACMLEPRSLVEDGVERGPRVFGGVDPPLGEIVRAMRRQSLVVVDTALGGEKERVPMESSGFTIAMNEIVQAIVQNELRSSDDFDRALATVAFHVQYWLSCFMDEEDYSIALALASHAVVVAETALEVELQDYSVALLLGNTARMLDIADSHSLAAHYLRAELRILDRCEGDQAVLRIQTAANLASVLYQGALRPREVADDIADALEVLIAQLPRAYEIDPEVTAHTVRNGLLAVVNLILDGGVFAVRIEQLRVALEQYSVMMPIVDRPDLGRELMQIHSLVRDGEYGEVIDRVNVLLEASGIVGLERPQLYRIRLECKVWLQDWDAAKRELQPFIDMATAGSLRGDNAAHLARNVSLAALQNLKVSDGPAAEIMSGAVEVADIYEASGGILQAHDKVMVELFRGIRSVLAGEPDRVRQMLMRFDRVELDRQNYLIGYLIHGLLNRWIEVSSCWSSSGVQATPAGVRQPSLSEEDFMGSVVVIPVSWRPLMAVAAAQAYVGVSFTADGYLGAAVDIGRALDLLGFPAQVVSTRCTLRLARDQDEVLLEQDPHYAIFCPQFERLVDPGISGLASSTDALPNPTKASPVIAQVGSSERFHAGPVGVLTEYGVLVGYDEVRSLANMGSASDVIGPQSSSAAFLIAFKALLALAACQDASSLVAAHPTLVDLIPLADSGTSH